MAQDDTRPSTNVSEGGRGQIWNQPLETLSREDIRELQGERLREQVKHVYKNSDFYREHYEEASLHPNDVKGLDDLGKVPTSSKDGLREYRQRTGDIWCGGLCVPESELEVVVHSTGTSGRPNYFGATKQDTERIAEGAARQYYSWGLRKGDLINVPGSMSWHGITWYWEHGIRKIGATPIRRAGDTQNCAEQVFEAEMDLADLDAIWVYQAESELEYIEGHDINPQEVFPNSKFIWSMVDASAPKRELWEETWGLPFRNAYGSGDQMWGTIQCQTDSEYFHLPEDHFIFEVLDPETDEPAEPGEYGVLHITNIRDEANPYIRYDMEDIVDFKIEPCNCGRTTMRVKPLGRDAWSVNVKSRNRPVTSIEVEEVLWQYDELYGENYQTVRTQPGEQTELTVRVATESKIPDDVAKDAREDLESTFGVPAVLEVVSPDEIGLESAIKMQRVADEY